LAVIIALDWHRVRLRAEQLAEEGLGSADAAHLAFAEMAAASFVTCDDRLIRQCRRVQLNVWCGDPMTFCSEESL
jgi:predicted nucleic acid-binding protein